jgi:hypothetical protein
MAKILTEVRVGLSEPIRKSLEMCVDFEGGTASGFSRQAILEKLIAKGYLKHPALEKYSPEKVAG